MNFKFFFTVFQMLGLLVSKPSLLWITANKASQTKSHLHMNVCVWVSVMMSSFKTFAQNKCFFLKLPKEVTQQTGGQ